MARKKAVDATTRRILNVIPSTRTEDDWGLAIALSSGVVKKVSPLPAEVDLRADWWAIGDQRETGGCVGFASADGVLRYHLVKTGKLRKNQRLSARFAWMASKETDTETARPQTFIEKAGTSLKAALDVGRKYGAVLDSVLPFDVRELMYTGDEDDFYAAAAQRKVASYTTWAGARAPGAPGSRLTARSWPPSASTKAGTRPGAGRGDSIDIVPPPSRGGTPCAWSATAATAGSSYGTAGERASGTGASPIRRMPG